MARGRGSTPRAGKNHTRAKILVGVTVLLIVSGVAIYLLQQPPSSGLLIDWRVRIVIHDTSKGVNQTLPPNIGVAGGLWFNHTFDELGPPGFAPLSTRDTTNTIYIQSTRCCPIFNFRDFFNIWGQVYNETCVGLGTSGVYCAGRADDPHIKYVDSDGSNSWNASEPVVYDLNSNNLYDTGDPIIKSPVPSPGASLKDDPSIYFVDTSNYNVWDPGEPVVYDVNKDFAFNSNDLGIAYVDANGNRQWDLGETIVYDDNGDATYQVVEPLISGTAPANNTALRVSLKTRFVDADGNNVWNSGETVVFDENDSLVFDGNDQVLFGPVPPVGTVLWREPVIAGAPPPAETSLIRPPPFLSDNIQERCLVGPDGQPWNLSNGKDWVLIIWSTLGISGGCNPGRIG